MLSIYLGSRRKKYKVNVLIDINFFAVKEFVSQENCYSNK